MVAPLNFGMLSSTADLLRNNQDFLAQNDAIAYGRNTFLSNSNNYSGHEDQSAVYGMGVINIGPQITIIPGVRYQNLQTSYAGSRGYESQLSYYLYRHYDTTVTQNHGYWLPDVSIRYKPTPWCDIRLSYSNTIAYPDYNAIIPRIDVNLNGVIAYNNFQLQPSRSTNYDVYVSVYENTIGLFTVGGFLKQIDNLIYPWKFYATGQAPFKYFPPQYISIADTANKKLFEIDTYVNDSYRINNYGAELDWQTHFWYLPGPLSGLVLNVNYTHIFSSAQYPFVNSVQLTPRSPAVFVDTSFTARLLDQPDDIINFAFGFDYGGFSARVSMLYQANIFTGPQFHQSVRTSTLAYRRWDIALKQDLPWFGIQLYGDLNNINSAKDISVIQAQGGIPQLQQDYGMTADFGIRLKL
jgi:TonB-dependent receptor